MSDETTVTAAAEYLGLSVSDTAYLVVSRVLDARVTDNAAEPNLQTVRVGAASVRAERLRRDQGLSSGVPGFRAQSRLDDEVEATRLLRRRRAQSQWPPEWLGGPVSQWPVTAADKRGMVVAVIRNHGGRMRVNDLVRATAGRTWSSPEAVHEVLADLTRRGMVEVSPSKRGRRGYPAVVRAVTTPVLVGGES